MDLGLVALKGLVAGRHRLGRGRSDDMGCASWRAPWCRSWRVLRGMGRQGVGALVHTLSNYYGVLPPDICLAFHGRGLGALWLGRCLGLNMAGILQCAAVGLGDRE